jgi:hypothetical protein
MQRARRDEKLYKAFIGNLKRIKTLGRSRRRQNDYVKTISSGKN